MNEKNKNFDKKKEIISRYNSTSKIYDKRYSTIQAEKYFLILSDYKINDKVILDEGCGTGLFYEYIMKNNKYHAKKFMYVGIDISWDMVMVFKSKLFKKKFTFDFQNFILQADLENLPFRDNVFNTIFSLTSLQNLPNINLGIHESIRVSKTNADLKFSILKKKLNFREIISEIKSNVSKLKIIEKEGIEDIFIEGFVSRG